MANKLAQFYHGFPHVDFNFHNTTVIFTPDKISYQQALLFNGVYILFAAAIFSLLFVLYFLICSCYFCAKCRPDTLKPKPAKSRCLRLLIGFLAFCSLGPLGIGFYANNQTRDGVERFSQSAENIYDVFDLYRFKGVVIQRYLQMGVTKELLKIEDEISSKFFNVSEIVNKMIATIKDVDRLCKDSGNLLKDSNVNLKELAKQFINYDALRWWITLSIYCWHLLLVLVMFYSVCAQQRCSFIVLTVMTLLCMFMMGGNTSFETPIGVAAGDICLNPNTAILQYISEPPSKAVVEYYLKCTNTSSGNTLEKIINAADQFLYVARKDLTLVENNPFILLLNNSKERLSNIKQALTNSEDELMQLKDIIGCTKVHKLYVEGIEAVCTTVIEGIGLLTLSSLIIFFLLAFILLLITPTWTAMAPLRPILKREKTGVHLVTNSYEGPPGGSESFQGDSSFDASYKSIEDREEFEHVPLVSRKDRPPSYRAIHGDTEFLSVEEEDMRRLRGNHGNPF